MSVKIYIKKSLNVFFWCLDKISRKAYVKFYPKYLNWLGIKIDTKNVENKKDEKYKKNEKLRANMD